MEYTEQEHQYLMRIRKRVSDLHNYLNTVILSPEADYAEYFAYMAHLRSIQGNISNNVSFLACLSAKNYLIQRFELMGFDAAAKAQGASGLDIDVQTIAGARIVGEIKTTVPYSGARNDFGANQKTAFKKDFAKLSSADAVHKFLFVTNEGAYKIIRQKYMLYLTDVEVVLLESPTVL